MKSVNPTLLNAIQCYGTEREEHIFYLHVSNRRGQIHTKEGRLTHAEYGRHAGMDALKAMFEDPELALSMDCIPGRPTLTTMDAAIDQLVYEVVSSALNDEEPDLEGTQDIARDAESDFDFHHLEPALEFMGEETDGLTLPLSPGRNLIGRSDECDILITSTDVSRKHCEIVVTADGIRLDDLGSVNGTYVNDVQIRSCKIKVGDLIQIGKTGCKLSFRVRRPGMNINGAGLSHIERERPDIARQTISFRELSELQARYRRRKQQPILKKILTSLIPGISEGGIFVECLSDGAQERL